MRNLKKILLLLISAILINKTYGQAGFIKLLPIDGMPVKIDGGCSFYMDTSLPLTQTNAQLVIDATHRAFVELLPNSFTFFKLSKRMVKGDGYIEYYKGSKKNSLIIEIKSVQRGENNSTVRNGTLYFNIKGVKQTLEIHGIVDERDKYYHKLYAH